MLGIIVAGIALLAFAAAPAQAAGIEGRWSVNEGEVTVTANPDGTFTGTVTAPTEQACPKPVGEVIWTEVRAQSDGSYWGKSQFYDQSCARSGQGPNAFRVLQTAAGAEYLKGCFSPPGGTQPTIAADGTAANAAAGCADFPRVGATDGKPAAVVLVKAVVKKAANRRWKVKVTGRVQLPAGASQSNCTGLAKIRLVFKSKRVGRGSTTVRAADCRFQRTFRIKRKKAPKGRLKVQASWPGTGAVSGDSGTHKAKIPKG